MNSESISHHPILKSTGINKSFGAFQVLHDVDFHVMPGEAVGVVGPNGAGKTTLFSALTGSFPISSGSIEFLNTDITPLSAPARNLMGLSRTYQVPRPFMGLSVFENVLVAAVSGARLSYDEASVLAADLLVLTELDANANTPAAAISLLDRKRLELARALATQPQLILLDEIGGGLTEAELDTLIALIKTLIDQGITVVWVEHILHALMRVVTRLVCMTEGRVLAQGDPQEVMSNPDVVAAYLGSEPA